VSPNSWIVEAHPLERRGHDHEEQRHEGAGEETQDLFVDGFFGSEQPVGEEEQREDERGHDDELEEAAPRVLRVGEAGEDLAFSAEEVVHLYDDEGEKEGAQETQSDAELYNPEVCERRAVRQVRRLFADEGRAEETRGGPGRSRRTKESGRVSARDRR
jgi:cobalamin biosynthesis protein CobT